MRVITVLLTLLVVHAASGDALAQSAFTNWVRERAREVAARRVAAERMDRDKDTETPSIAKGTSLVDQTEAPDLIGLAMSLYDAAGNDSDKAPVTVTVSGWTLRNAVTNDDPLDPSIYAKGANWRRWSFTVGRELGDGSAAAARLLGAKAVLWNGRDVSSRANAVLIRELNVKLPEIARQLADADGALEDYLFETLRPRVSLAAGDELQQRGDFVDQHLSDAAFATTIALLTQEELQTVDAILLNRVPAEQALQDQVRRTVAAIRGAPQLAVSYQARLLPDGGADEHRWQAIFDYGATEAFKVSVNGSFDLTRVRDVDDERGGRLAVEFTSALSGRTSAAARAAEILRARPPRSRSPLSLSGSWEAQWRSDRSATNRLQAKLTIPIPGLRGLTLPISLTYANDPDLIDEEHDVLGQVGFTFDFSQLKRALTRSGQ
jgi:hypothetical protein